MPSGGSEAAKMDAAIDAIAKDAFAGKRPPTVCLKDGDTKEYDGFAGNMFVPASRKDPFKTNQLVARDKTPITTDGVFYAGCKVNAVFSVWAQNNSFGKKINAEIVALQFVQDGEKLSVGATSDITDDTFAELPPLDVDADSII